MLKFIVVGFIILATGAIVLGCNNNSFQNSKENGIDSSIKNDELVDVQEGGGMVDVYEGDLINFQLYKSYAVDTSGFYERFHIVEGTSFAYFQQVYDLKGLKYLGDFREVYSKLPAFDDVYPDDYQDKFLAVTFGRELLEIEIIKKAISPSNSVEVAITFSEEYHDGVLFLYIMDKIYLRDGLGSKFYIMDDSTAHAYNEVSAKTELRDMLEDKLLSGLENYIKLNEDGGFAKEVADVSTQIKTDIENVKYMGQVGRYALFYSPYSILVDTLTNDIFFYKPINAGGVLHKADFNSSSLFDMNYIAG